MWSEMAQQFSGSMSNRRSGAEHGVEFLGKGNRRSHLNMEHAHHVLAVALQETSKWIESHTCVCV